MYGTRVKRNVSAKQLEKGITGKLSEQEMAYAYIEGKHGAEADSWAFRLFGAQYYRYNHDIMMNFIKGYVDHER
jgi:hypothetical protein